MDIWVARQPILDRKQQLYAYELLFRSQPGGDCFDGSEAAAATTRVVADSLLGIGIDKLLSGRKAFINFDRSLLLSGLWSILPCEDTVIEILETVEADPEIMDACRNLYQRGYRIALDDFVRRPETEPLTDFAQIVKVDMRTTPREEQERMLKAYQQRGICMLAEKVETREEFDWALAAGYDYFQGYFFARPAIVPGTQIPQAKAVSLRLLHETDQAELDYERIETLVAGDVSLSWQLLRYVNSALSYRRAAISSIRQALAMLGEQNIRQWTALATLSRLAKDKPDELLVLSLVRAHFSQFLMKLTNVSKSPDAFLMGLFSLLDALLDLPLEEALRRADVAPAIKAALTGTAPEKDLLRGIRGLVEAWESGDWAGVTRLAAQMGIPVSAVGDAYIESTQWAEKALQGVARRSYSRRWPRRPGSGTLKLQWSGGAGREGVVKGNLIDISAGGLRLEMKAAIPANSAVSFEFAGIRGRGIVRYCISSDEKYLIGIERSDESEWIEDAANADERIQNDCVRTKV